MSSATKAPGAEGPGAYGIPGLPDRLSQSDQLRIFSAYYADRLPAEAAAELCEFADEWDEQIASAPAPSDPAGAGGDLGKLERKIDAAAEAILSRRGFGYYTDPMEGGQDAYDISLEAREEATAALKAAGQLVASTPGQKGAGEEKTGACLTAPGSCPSGPTASRSSGFAAAIPSRDALRNLCWSEMPKYGLMSFEQLSEAVSEVMLADRYYKRAILHTEIFIGHEVMTINFNSLNRIVTAFVQAALALGTEAGTAETFGLGPKDDGPADLSATPAQTPPSPPSATPEGDPPMTVEEARELMDGLADCAEYFRGAALRHDVHPGSKVYFQQRSDYIELALRTLHAAGEVRHG